ncbi:MAG: hypothetical protein ACYTEX_16110 [Planctomycetota bacterium]
MSMTEVKRLKVLLDKIDNVLRSYDPGEPRPDQIIGEIIKERASQRPTFEEAIQLATEGLRQYPYNSELLRRRAFARCLIITPEGEHPELEAAEEDLRMILELDANNLCGVFELLDAMFSHSAMEDDRVAEVAGELASRTQTLLLQVRALQIKALGYADKHDEADRVYKRWIELFPKSEYLKSAREQADQLRGSEEPTS